MAQTWVELENHARAIAELRWNSKCVEEHIDGVDFDGVIRISRDEIVIIECTVENNLEKVRADINKIAPTRMRLAASGVLCRGFIVLRDSPTRSMREAGEQQHITVCSISEFERDLFDFQAYVHLREKHQFGSAVDPTTGATDSRSFVPVEYVDTEKGRHLTIDNISDDLIQKKHIVLVGDYGTGKSRCAREVFSKLKQKSNQAGAFTLSINLREHWGSRTAIEILTGHLSSLGLSTSFDNIIRLYNSGNLILLLDGFDEVGAQTFDFRRENRTSIRRHALEGVRDLISKSKGGVLITGRSHYFDSDAELLSCLGLAQLNRSTKILKSPDDFTTEQGESYLRTIGIDASIPKWLPRKPLVFQVLGSIGKAEVASLLSKDFDQFPFWATFIQAVCRREANIHTTLAPSAVHAVLLELAQTARLNQEALGRLTPADISDAYERAIGNAPDDSGKQMLSRLCMLGRLEPESPDRQFIDRSILDILRGERLVMDIFQMKGALDGVPWKQSLGIKGTIYAANQVAMYDLEPHCLSFLSKFSNTAKPQQLAEIVSLLTLVGTEPMDFRAIQLLKTEIPIFHAGQREIKNISIRNSLITMLVLDNCKISDRSGVSIDSSLFSIVSGVSNPTGLPNWIKSSDVIEFERISNVSRIRDSHTDPSHKLFLSIIHKIFFQPGKGREEASLLKGGFGQKYDPKLIQEILKLLRNEGLVERFKGDDGWVYTPNRRHTDRMAKIMAELSLSEDKLWKEVGKLT